MLLASAKVADALQAELLTGYACVQSSTAIAYTLKAGHESADSVATKFDTTAVHSDHTMSLQRLPALHHSPAPSVLLLALSSVTCTG